MTRRQSGTCYSRTQPRWALLCCLLVVYLPARATADGIIRDSQGGVSSGRAGANTAAADNGAVLASNPAALINIKGSGLIDLRLDMYPTAFEYSDEDNSDVDSEQIPAFLPEASIILKTAGSSFAYGLGVLTSGGFSTEYHMQHAAYGRQLYRSFAALVKVLPAVSYKMTEELSVGVALGLALSQVKFTAPYTLQTGLFAGTVALADLNSYGVAPAWSAGIQYELTENTMLGAAYISESDFTLHGRTRLGLGDLSARYDTDVEFEWPRSAVLGLRHALSSRHEVFIDATWMNWQRAFDVIGFDLSDGDSAQLPSGVQDALTLDWRDSWGVRAGYEYWLDMFVLRCGYAFHSNPVPDDRLNPLIPGILEHFVSVGVGRQWGAWRSDVAYGYSFGPRLETHNSAFVGDDYDESRLSARSHGVFFNVTRYFSIAERQG